MSFALAVALGAFLLGVFSVEFRRKLSGSHYGGDLKLGVGELHFFFLKINHVSVT